MSLVNLDALLQDARRRGYAVGSFNMVGFGFLNGIREAAEEENSPVILSIAEVHLPHMQIEQFVPVALQSAQRARDHNLGDRLLLNRSSVVYVPGSIATPWWTEGIIA